MHIVQLTFISVGPSPFVAENYNNTTCDKDKYNYTSDAHN